MGESTIRVPWPTFGLWLHLVCFYQEREWAWIRFYYCHYYTITTKELKCQEQAFPVFPQKTSRKRSSLEFMRNMLITSIACKLFQNKGFIRNWTILENDVHVNVAIMIDDYDLLNHQPFCVIPSLLFSYCHTNERRWLWCVAYHVTHRLIALLLFLVFLGLGLGGGAGFVLPKAFVTAATRPLSRALTERLRWSSIVCLARDRLRMSAAFDFCTGNTYAKSHWLFLLFMHDWENNSTNRATENKTSLLGQQLSCVPAPLHITRYCFLCNSQYSQWGFSVESYYFNAEKQ